MLFVVISAQPFPVRSAATTWAATDETRERYYQAISGYLERELIDALVVKSVDFSIPAWVELKAWMPRGDSTSLRTRLRIEIATKPHFRYPAEVDIVVSQRGREKKYRRLVNFTETDAVAWSAYSLGRGNKPSLRGQRQRWHPLQFWRPLNKVDRLKRDPLSLLALILFIAAIALVAYYPMPALVAAAFVGAVIVGYFAARRTKLIVNSEKPAGEPRYLSLVDSWHVTLLGLGPEGDAIRGRVKADFESDRLPQLSLREEKVSYIGVDGKQERDQLVLRLGRGVLFCHIYRYGADLFLGWDAYANYGEWSEYQVAYGYDRQARAPVVINGLKPALYTLTEYDLIDLDCLAEWTHARLTRLVKRVIDEKNIDQEIDFKIIRGERQSLIRSEAGDGGADGGRGRSARGPAFARRS